MKLKSLLSLLLRGYFSLDLQLKITLNLSINKETLNRYNSYMNKDYVTYAKYRVIRNRSGKVIDLEFVFANQRMKDVLGFDPTGKFRSAFMPINSKICEYVQNVIDIGVAKHFSYTDNKIFGYIEGIIEQDLSDMSCVNVYTVDVNQIKASDCERTKNNISTILSMFNVTLLHWNIKEHYIYSDNILTTNFSESNPDLYVGNNIRSSYSLYKITDEVQKKLIEREIERLKIGEISFMSFNLTAVNSIGQNIDIKVNVIPEDRENMYLIGIQY